MGGLSGWGRIAFRFVETGRLPGVVPSPPSSPLGGGGGGSGKGGNRKVASFSRGGGGEGETPRRWGCPVQTPNRGFVPDSFTGWGRDSFPPAEGWWEDSPGVVPSFGKEGHEKSSWSPSAFLGEVGSLGIRHRLHFR